MIEFLKHWRMQKIVSGILRDKSKSKKVVVSKRLWIKAVEPEYLDVSEFKSLLEQEGVTGVALVVTKRGGVEYHAKHIDNIFELAGGLSRLEAKINRDGMLEND